MYMYYYMVESRTLYPNMWRVVNLIHILLLLAHWFGCFYYMLSEAEQFQGDWTYPYYHSGWTGGAEGQGQSGGLGGIALCSIVGRINELLQVKNIISKRKGSIDLFFCNNNAVFCPRLPR